MGHGHAHVCGCDMSTQEKPCGQTYMGCAQSIAR